VLGQLVLLMAIVAGVAFAGQLRRGEPSQRGYVVALAGVTVAAIVAALRGDEFLAVVAVCMTLLVVVMPWALDLLVRACFHRERLAWAVRLSGLRALLMPGAGLHRQQAILHGLLLLEQRGVDGALSYFRELAQATEDDVELRVIHEQIVSMLLFGQRWSEGIAHYEARFPPGYAAQRPPLALGLLRAYGESGRLGHAAGLLRAVEELLGRDPRAAGVVSQARLTFLAYVGQTTEVASALTDDRRRRLGLSAASGALLHGIALARAGRPQAAEVELRRVEDLAGAHDDRVVHASRKAIARAPDQAVELPPELRSYAEHVAGRLEGFLSAAPLVRRAGALLVTPLLLVLLSLGYAATLSLDGGGAGLLQLGAATPELVRAGAWGRLLTGMLVQSEPLALLLSIYGLWLAGPLCERLYGRGRTLVVTLGAGAAGLAAAVMLTPEPAAVLGGGVLLTTGVVTGMLLVLLSPRTNLPKPARRRLALPLVLLLLGLAVMIPRGGHGLDVSPAGMVVAAVVGVLGLGLGAPLGRVAAVLRGVGGLVALALPVAVVFVAGEDPRAFTLEHRRTVAAEGVSLRVPTRFAVVDATPAESAPEPWPLQPGLHDTLAQRVGDRVQLLVTPTAADPASPSALLRVRPDLARAFVEVPAGPPEAFAQAWEHAAGPTEAPLRSTILRRNGHDVGVVLERSLGQGVSVVLVASPPEALAHDAALYATILAEARG
jgi:membrane associated rhomboid family serine protease